MLLEIPAEKIITTELLQELEALGLRPLAFAVIVENIEKEVMHNGKGEIVCFS